MFRHALVVFVSLLTGCGFIADPQIKSVEIKDSSGGTLEITTYEMEYSGGKLESIKITRAQQVVQIIEVGYSGDKIETVTYKVPDPALGDQVTNTLTLDYDGDNVSKVTDQAAAGGDPEFTTYEYDDDDRLETVTENAEDDDTTNDQVTSYEYDDDGRISLRRFQSAGNAQDYTFKYDDEEGFGQLESVKFESGGTPTTIGFKYDDVTRQLSRVSVPNSSESITYGDDGLVTEIKQGSGATAVTTSFKYNDDNGVEGMNPRLMVSFGELFTLEGRRVDQIDVVSGILGD
jgi:hypothetical protein